ncbi:MAG: hypothetical protein RLY35_1958 [Bacteroidota bacterium]|jgi:hypothetical protein
MILRSFTQNSPLLPFTYPIVILLILLSGYQELSEHALNIPFVPLSPIALITAFSLLLSFNALLINSIYNRSELYHSPVYLTGLVYALFSSVIAVQTGNLKLVIAQSFALVALYFAFSIFRQKKIAHYLFLSSLFLGISILLDWHNFALVILLIVLSFWNRSFAIKDILLVIAGFITPTIYWILYHWLNLSSTSLLDFWNLNPVSSLPHSVSPPLTFLIIFLISIVLALISLSHKEDRQSNKTVQSKQYLIMLLVLSAASNILQILFFQDLNLHDLLSLASILLLSQYWTHYRTSLLAPFVFYLMAILTIIQFFHWF